MAEETDEIDLTLKAFPKPIGPKHRLMRIINDCSVGEIRNLLRANEVSYGKLLLECPDVIQESLDTNQEDVVTELVDCAAKTIHQTYGIKKQKYPLIDLNGKSKFITQQVLLHMLYLLQETLTKLSDEELPLCNEIIMYLKTKCSVSSDEDSESSSQCVTVPLFVYGNWRSICSSLLHVACQIPRDASLVSLLLTIQGLDVQIADENMNTPLHHACMSPCDSNLVSQLSEYVTNANCLNTEGYTPLSIILSQLETQVEEEEFQIVKDLLEIGADPNMEFEFKNAPLMQRGLWKGCVSVVPIQVAVMLGHRITQILLHYGADAPCNTGLKIISDFLDNSRLVHSEPKNPDLYQLTQYLSNLNMEKVMTGSRISLDVLVNCVLPVLHSKAITNSSHSVRIIKQVLEVRTLIPDLINYPYAAKPCLYHMLSKQALEVAQLVLEAGAIVNVVSHEHDSMTASFLSQVMCMSLTSKTIIDCINIAETLLNKGILSRVYYTIVAVPHHHWRYQYIECGPLITCATVIIDVLTVVLPRRVRHCETYNRVLTLLLNEEIHLHMSKECLRHMATLMQMPNMSGLPDGVAEMLLAEATSFCSLKSLCRAHLREHLSTIHGRTLRPFDLRDLCARLPLPSQIQKFLTVRLNTDQQEDIILETPSHLNLAEH